MSLVIERLTPKKITERPPVRKSVFKELDEKIQQKPAPKSKPMPRSKRSGFGLFIAFGLISALTGASLFLHQSLQNEIGSRQALQVEFFRMFDRMKQIEEASKLNQTLIFTNQKELRSLDNRTLHVWREIDIHRNSIYDTYKELAINDSQIALLGRQVHLLNQEIFPESFSE